jgi:hypothetical protein
VDPLLLWLQKNGTVYAPQVPLQCLPAHPDHHDVLRILRSLEDWMNETFGPGTPKFWLMDNASFHDDTVVHL